MLSIHLDPLDLVSTLDNIATKQLGYATAIALNDTAKEFQVAERAVLASNFTLRRASFIDLNAVKILKPVADASRFATAKNLSITIGVDPKAEFLGKFEEGGEKVAIGGQHLLAIPTKAVKPTITTIIPDVLRPKYLFSAFPDQIFAVRPGDKSRLTPGIYQRVARATEFAFSASGSHRIGSKNKGAPVGPIQLLYLLRPEAHISPILDYESTAIRVVDERFARNFSEAFMYALGTARGATPIFTLAR